MREQEIKNNFSENMLTLRKKARLTQAQLGEKLGYSDKSVSKWENGDVMPDVVVLDHIAEYFGVTVNDLISKRTSFELQKRSRHSLIVAGTFCGVMAVACFIYLLLTTLADIDLAWLSFVYAPPVFFVSMIVLTAIFFNYKMVMLAVSLLTWSIILAVYLTLLGLNIWMLFVVGGVLQVLYVLILFTIKLYKKKETKLNQTN